MGQHGGHPLGYKQKWCVCVCVCVCVCACACACAYLGAPTWRSVVSEEPERPGLQPGPGDDPPAGVPSPAKVHPLPGQSAPGSPEL